jgi:hypothetical protein
MSPLPPLLVRRYSHQFHHPVKGFVGNQVTVMVKGHQLQLTARLSLLRPGFRRIPMLSLLQMKYWISMLVWALSASQARANWGRREAADRGGLSAAHSGKAMRTARRQRMKQGQMSITVSPRNQMMKNCTRASRTFRPDWHPHLATPLQTPARASSLSHPVENTRTIREKKKLHNIRKRSKLSIVMAPLSFRVNRLNGTTLPLRNPF